jgi:acetyl esterase/lipase
MQPPLTPVTKPALPFFTRMRLLTLLWLFQFVVRTYCRFLRLSTNRLPLYQKPTFTKNYGPTTSESRVFIPKSYKPGDAPLPLLIDIHGGGFCVSEPVLDDPDNLILAHRHGLCVVSIPYRLGPQAKFPAAPQDCAAAIAAVLDDESLPVDRSRVAVAGYSAGANLALTATQLPGIRGRIKGVVAYYPVTDWTITKEEKMARQKLAPDGKDILHLMMPFFDIGYVAPDVDRADPLLSPGFAKRENLPEKIAILGCEYDILCKEAELMAEDLATEETGQKISLDDGRVGWTKGNVRWELIEDKHGFNQTPTKGEEEKKRIAKTEKMHAGIAQWLKKEVYA